MNGVAVMISVLIIIILVITILIVINSCKDKFTDNDNCGYGTPCKTASDCCASFYNSSTQKLMSDPSCQNNGCQYSTIQKYCPADSYPNGQTYNIASQGCCGDKTVYNTSSQGCCGDNPYSTKEDTCINGKVYPGTGVKLCPTTDEGEVPYTDGDHFCVKNMQGNILLQDRESCEQETRSGCRNDIIFCNANPDLDCKDYNPYPGGTQPIDGCGYCPKHAQCQTDHTYCVGPNYSYDDAIFTLYKNN